MPNRLSSRPAVAALSVALTGGAVPTEIRLLPWGRFRAADGSGRPEGVPGGWVLDERRAGALVGAARARASDYVIDYEHQTLLAEKNGQPAPAAGWFKDLEARPGDGLYAVDVRWTERAAAMIAAGEYRYLSPVFSYDRSGAILALGPAALTNNPGLDGLTDLSRVALAAFFPEEVSMKELLKALGLPETATEAEALAALAAIQSAHAGELAALKGAAPDPAKFVPMAQHAQVQNELAALTAKVESGERDALMTAALADGRVLPAQEAYWRAQPLAALKSYLEVAQPLAALKGGTQTGGKSPAGGAGSGDVGLSEVELAVCRQMGIAPEDYAKTRAVAAV